MGGRPVQHNPVELVVHIHRPDGRGKQGLSDAERYADLLVSDTEAVFVNTEVVFVYDSVPS